jgi:epoxyqueuosine reductase
VTDLVIEVKQAARELGFEVVGITSATHLARDEQSFHQWCNSGFAAGMDYMTRKPELNAHPKRLTSWAASIITVAVNYFVPAPVFEHRHRFGRVARYAWGLDYHDVIRRRLTYLVGRVEQLAGRTIHARCFVDAVPLLERGIAARAGLGFFGKNTNLLQPGRGSWFFLAEVLLDLDLPAEDRDIRVSCGTCQRCIDACPTNAFAEPYVLDSSRCISYLTIENKGSIPIDLRSAVGEWIFGCDICQEMTPGNRIEPLPEVERGHTEEVCPFNRFATETDWKELRPEAGTGMKVDLVELLSIDSETAFRERFRSTPLLRPKRRGLLRNAAVVARNIGCTAAVPVLVERIENESEPLIRSHSLWAVAGLDRKRVAPLIERLRKDPDQHVRKEATDLADALNVMI